MLPIVKFALDNIYCAPSQDQQYTFKLRKVNYLPIVNYVTIYNALKRLPDTTNKYNVFVIGNLSPSFINLLGQKKEWYKDSWISLEEDSIDRNYIAFLYDDNGIKFPNSHIYYSFINESSIVIAVKLDTIVNNIFTGEYRNFRVYSNSYFDSLEYNSLPNKLGIESTTKFVLNNVDKVTVQNWILSKEQYGGKSMVFVNGIYHDNVTLTINNNSFIEVIYDQSFVERLNISIEDLRQFTSLRDNVNKYLLVKDKILPSIEYFDDNEFFITTSTFNNNRGVYYYRHNITAASMITDKDYSLNAQYVNNLATYLNNNYNGNIQDKRVTIYIRKPGLIRNLVYSDSMLHELYKLNNNLQLDILNGTINSIPYLRAENLEDSDYFKLASIDSFVDLTKELCTDVLGYDATAYYFGKNIVFVNSGFTYVDVPLLYREPSMAYEYDITGKLLGYHTTSGPEYLINDLNTKYVEFIQGRTPNSFNYLYDHNETITLEYDDYVVISANFVNGIRITEWENITNTNKVIKVVNEITINEDTGKKVLVLYLNQPNIYDLNYDISNGSISFPLQIRYNKGNGINTYSQEIPSLSIEIFLNNYRLIEGLDYFIDFPNISICNKKYLNYTNVIQNIHIRCHGFTTNIEDINKHEIKGFVNNGVLGRNNIYDIRDNRLLSIFIDGKLQDRNDIIFAEEDNSNRLVDPLNGLPYVMSEPIISIKEATGINTYDYYVSSKEKDDLFSNFFNQINPEPDIYEFNIIANRHTVFSPLLSKIIVDMKLSIIPESLYTNPYDDLTIIDYIDTHYSLLYKLDPIKFNLQESLVDIHPHLGNSTIDVNFYQFKFLSDINRIISNNRVNLSGYINIST